MLHYFAREMSTLAQASQKRVQYHNAVNDTCSLILFRKYPTQTIKKARYHDAVYDTCYFFLEMSHTLPKKDRYFYTHRHFYTQKLLHRNTLTHRDFYTQKLSHTNAFHTDISNHRHFHTHTLFFHTATLSHTDAFIRKILSLQTLKISK